MSDLHDAFRRLADGAGARRTICRARCARTRSACPGCLRAAGAFDALAAIDLGSGGAPTTARRRRHRLAGEPGLVPATAPPSPSPSSPWRHRGAAGRHRRRRYAPAPAGRARGRGRNAHARRGRARWPGRAVRHPQPIARRRARPHRHADRGSRAVERWRSRDAESDDGWRSAARDAACARASLRDRPGLAQPAAHAPPPHRCRPPQPTPATPTTPGADSDPTPHRPRSDAVDSCRSARTTSTTTATADRLPGRSRLPVGRRRRRAATGR